MRSRSRFGFHFTHAMVGLAVMALAAFVSAHPAGAASSKVGAIGGDWETVDARPLAGQRITALLTDAAGVLWVGTEERGLAAWDGASWRTYRPADGLPDDRIVALFADREGRLWISTGTGLVYLPADGGPFRRIGPDVLRTLPILALAQAADGSILFGGISGLQVWQEGRASQPAPELDGQQVLALKTDRDGISWAGTPAGLWRGAGGRWQRETSVGAGRIMALHESAGGLLYAGGVAARRAALWRLEGERWQEVPTPALGQTTAIAELKGNLWLGGAQGIVAGQGEVWESYDPSLLPSATVTALEVGRGGELWIGTNSGLAAHRPDSGAPSVAIKSIDGVSPDQGTVRLAGDRIAVVELVAEDQFTPPTQLRIFTRLEGVDATPRLLTAAEARDLSRVTAYADHRLPPGSHVLRVWAQDDAFNRSPETQVRLTVPELAYGPAGLAVRRDTALAGVTGLALVLAASATTGAAVRAGRRHSARVAAAAAAHVRAVADRSSELYAQPVTVRVWEAHEIIGALPARSVLVLGGRGAGKTTVLGQLAHALRKQDDRSPLFAPATVDLATTPPQQLFHTLIQAANQACEPLIVGARPRLHWREGRAMAYGEQEFSADLGTLLAWLQPQFTRRLVLVFLLDNAEALDRCEGPCRDAFRRLIVAGSGAAATPGGGAVASTAPGVRLVVACETAPAIVEGFDDLFHTVQLAPVSPGAATKLLREGTRGMVEWDPQAEQAAIEQGAGNPGKLASLGRAASRAAIADNRLRITAADVP